MYMSAETKSQPASDKQIAFITTLRKQRQVSVTQAKQMDIEIANGMTKQGASKAISTLKALPMASAGAAVTEQGIYETPDGTVYVAKFNKQKTRLYAKRLHETGERVTEAGTIVTIDFEYAAGAIYKLTPDMKMDPEKAKALTVKYGRCLICGRKLKAAKSVEAGVGPICSKVYG